jgi:tyrosine-specific transport protein
MPYSTFYPKTKQANKVEIIMNTNRLPLGTMLSTIFLVAGACIGGGMLALPTGTGVLGFLPSIVMMVITWFFMTLSGLFILEVNIWLKNDAHIITMASTFLGRWGKAMAWILYLFIGYASLVSYTSGGGAQIQQMFEYFSGITIQRWVGSCICTLLFGWTIFIGRKTVGRVNTILFIAMLASYALLIVSGTKHIHLSFLTHRVWGHAPIAAPLLLTAFSFHSIIPSLTPALNYNAKQLRFCIIAGTSLSLVIYFIWQAIILGTVPLEGDLGLMEAFRKGDLATLYFRAAVKTPWISFVADYFSFFALITSFLGISLGLFDFLADGLSIPKKGWWTVLLGSLVIVPSLFFAIRYSRAFYVAMSTSGGFGDTILSGIMPLMMVWIGRYYRKCSDHYRVCGGKFLIVITFIFYSIVFILEIFEQCMGYSIISLD